MLLSMKGKHWLWFFTLLLLIPYTLQGGTLTKVGDTALNLLTTDGNQSWYDQKILFLTTQESNHNYLAVINSDGTGYQKLSDDTGFISDYCWSKDGSKIYYQLYENGYDTLWRMGNDGSQKSKILQTAANSSIEQFSLSPNNSKIAYKLYNIETDEATLNIIDNDGGNKRELTIADPCYWGGGFDWANDSANLVYFHQKNGNLLSSASINIITTENTADTVLVSSVTTSQIPRWQPGGNKILYAKSGTLYSINDNGTGNTTLTTVYSSNFLWSPDATKILLTDTDLKVMNSDGTGLHTLKTNTFFAGWSNDSAKVIFSDYQNLSTIETDGANEIKLTNNTKPAMVADSFFNGTGQKIAYLAFYDIINSPAKIIVTNKAASTTKEITVTNMIGGNLCWNPKNEQIIYQPYITTGNTTNYQLWSVQSDGTNDQQLADNGENASFSPDGTKIVYSKVYPGNGILTMNSDGTNKTQLTTSYEQDPAWAPSGNSIAYVSATSPTSNAKDIYVMTTTGTVKTNLTNYTDSTTTMKPSWSPDSAKIAYLVEDDRHSDPHSGLWVIDANGSNKKQLYHFSTIYIDQKPLWDNNHRIYFIAGYPQTQLYSIKDDGTDLKVEIPYSYNVEAFDIFPQTNTLSFTSVSGIFLYEPESTSTTTTNTVDNPLIIGNNVFHPANGQKAYIFIPSGLNGVNVSIFTLSGVLVRKYTDVSAASISWDGKNEDGETVASGVYIILLESDQATKKEKIILIK
ncbi:MAG: DUF5050 domain-containing protein [Elusimicrobia bacterium]|nr:DUF5050 domain-containing protein [Elusimicrobiota bacterium]